MIDPGCNGVCCFTLEMDNAPDPIRLLKALWEIAERDGTGRMADAFAKEHFACHRFLPMQVRGCRACIMRGHLPTDSVSTHGASSSLPFGCALTKRHPEAQVACRSVLGEIIEACKPLLEPVFGTADKPTKEVIRFSVRWASSGIRGAAPLHSRWCVCPGRMFAAGCRWFC